MFIGISAYNHESAVSLVDKEGNLIDYCKEESLSRIKGDRSFPRRSIDRILKNNNIQAINIERIIFYEKPLSAYLIPLKIASMYIPQSNSFIIHQLRNFNKASISCFIDLAKYFPGNEQKLSYIDHHLAHTLTALTYSNIQKNICSIVVDGFGDRSTASISYIKDMHNIKEIWSSEYPHSLGLFYSAITDFLGFNINEGEYKVMGLSAYGNKDSRYAKIIGKLINWDDCSNKIKLDLEYFSFYKSIIDSYSKNLIYLLGEPRNPFKPLLPKDDDFQKYADIARGAQDITIKILIKIFEHAYKITNSNIFLFSGGVALNSASLDSLAKLDFVEEIIVPPSPGDSGAAIGTGMYGYLQSTNNKTNITTPSLYPSKYSASEQSDQIEKLLSNKFRLITMNKEESLLITSKLIQKGEIIGTIISNSETGPRALGNRSLICNGLNKESVERLNTVIKNRSPFRPTAPAMKLGIAKKYYCLEDALITSYYSMTATCMCKENSISRDFPVTHVDGSARIQIVKEGSILDQLLDLMSPKGIEILANSSINLSGDPTCFDLIDGIMVCSLSPLEYLLTDLGLYQKIIK